MNNLVQELEHQESKLHHIANISDDSILGENSIKILVNRTKQNEKIIEEYINIMKIKKVPSERILETMRLFSLTEQQIHTGCNLFLNLGIGKLKNLNTKTKEFLCLRAKILFWFSEVKLEILKKERNLVIYEEKVRAIKNLLASCQQ